MPSTTTATLAANTPPCPVPAANHAVVATSLAAHAAAVDETTIVQAMSAVSNWCAKAYARHDTGESMLSRNLQQQHQQQDL